MSSGERPLVTIAIPTYNRADGFLEEALKSALQQSYDPIEVLVSDNCSTDATSDLVKKYDQTDLRYIRHEKNLGALGNFNFCVEAARGEYFLMLHDDDRIDPDFVQTCISGIPDDASGGKQQVSYVRTGVRLIDENGNVISRHLNGAAGARGGHAVLKWMQCQNYWAFAATLFNTEILRETGGFSEEFSKACEIHAMARIALKKMNGIELEPVKASFRKHEGTLTNHTSVRAWIDEWHGIHHQIVEWAPSPSLRRQFHEAGSEFFSRMCYDLVSGIDGPLQRYSLYLAVYSKFGGRYLPPNIRKTLRQVKNSIVGGKNSQEAFS